MFQVPDGHAPDLFIHLQAWVYILQNTMVWGGEKWLLGKTMKSEGVGKKRKEVKNGLKATFFKISNVPVEMYKIYL